MLHLHFLYNIMINTTSIHKNTSNVNTLNRPSERSILCSSRKGFFTKRPPGIVVLLLVVSHLKEEFLFFGATSRNSLFLSRTYWCVSKILFHRIRSQKLDISLGYFSNDISLKYLIFLSPS